MEKIESKKEIYRKIFFWIAVLLGLFFFFKSLGIWWVIILIVLMWSGVIYMIKKFTFDKQGSWGLVIGAIIVVIIFSFLVIPGKSGSNNEEKKMKTSKNLSQYDGRIYNIVSENGMSGTAAITITDNVSPVRVQYNFHISDTLPMNKKCVEGSGKTDKHCRWIDFYNYAAGISTTDNAEVTGVTQFYPVFCDTVATSDDVQKGMIGTYLKCWYGKGSTPRETGLYYWGGMTSFESIDEFLKHDTLHVYDAAPQTTRTYEFKDNTGTSIDKMDTQAAVDEGRQMKIYQFTFE